MPGKWGAGHVPHPCSSQQSLLAVPDLLRLQWSWAHCTLCCVYTTSKGSEVMLPDSGVPGTQRKLFSSFRWCLDGRTSLEYLMSLGSDVPTLRDQHVLRRCKSSSLKEFHPQSWASKLQPFGASLIPLTSVLDHAGIWSTFTKPLFPCLPESCEQASPQAAEGRPKADPRQTLLPRNEL